MAGPTHIRAVLCAAAFLVALSGSGALSQVALKSSLEKEAFLLALKKVSDERKGNSANGFSITHFFLEFRRSDDVSDYVAFFKSIDIPAIVVDANGQHFVYFELPSQQLKKRGFLDFRPDDRLVIVFTTASAFSNEITSFSAQLFGKTLP